MKRYIDSYGMLCESWLKKDDDRLWRTALYCIINPEHTKNLYGCFKRGCAYRHPLDSMKAYNDCSRDQVIMAFVAFYLNEMPQPNLCKRFSDKFKQTFDMRWWIKALEGSRLHTWLFITCWRIALPVLFRWNDFWWDNDKVLYWKWRYPYYSFHILSWMVYCLPDMRAKWKLNNYCVNYIWEHDTGNLLLLNLHGYRSSADSVSVTPKTDFQWQRRKDRIPPGVELLDYDGYYQIDVDIEELEL